MPQKQFDLIVFDWDGTLMDSTSTIVRCIQSAARDLGLPVPHDSQAAYVIGLTLPDAMRAVLPDVDPHYHPKMVERYRYHYLTSDHKMELFPGVQEMLADLVQAKYFVAVATGKNRAGLDRALDEFNLRSTFDATRCGDETFSKPHPAMLQEITRDLGQELNRTVMIGDTSHDLLMASNAGAAGIAVEFGAHDPVSLRQYNPIFSAKSIPELHEWLVVNA
jgi:phosphoglycolate phosphatase